MVIIQATYRRPTRLSSHFSHNYPNFLARLPFFFFIESTVVPKHAVKAYGGSEGIASLINLANTTGKQGPVGPTVSLVLRKKEKSIAPVGNRNTNPRLSNLQLSHYIHYVNSAPSSLFLN